MTSILKVDQIQKNDGSTPTAADLGINVSGSVLQVVQYTFSGYNASTSTSFWDSGLGGSITPSSSSSKILVIINAVVGLDDNDGDYGRAQITRGPNGSESAIMHSIIGRDVPDMARVENSTLVYLDSPNTTSSTQYKFRLATTGSGSVRMNYTNNTYGGICTMILQEIAG